ncbi:MAG: nickel-dependent hydrogenase large subunit [Chloroflexi bacterium]|nr:nickel-dependent hydrogenase large subunit [Chloroflexota bacterium]
MAERIVVDPITRIEGHLRIEAELDAANTITAAYSSGTQVRGIEIILRGRDPRDAWAFTQRVCGVCTTVHSFASLRAVEDALDITIPKNANLIRNLMVAQQFVHDHVMHFYHLHALDWVDIVSGLDADPAESASIQQAISPNYPNASPAYFKKVQDQVKAIVQSGQLGLFANAYWGHPAYKLPPAVNLLATAHYLEALDWQREVVKLHALFGGKNPHPNFVVGGVPTAINPAGDLALNAEGLSLIKNVISSIQTFVDQVYLPDLLAIAPFYKEWAGYGENGGNFLSWGEFPLDDPRDTANQFVPRGAIMDRDLSNIIDPDPKDFAEVKEFIARSWYDYEGGKDSGLHPFEGETTLNYSGPTPPYDFLEVDKSYSWMKAPRFREKPMEVGPLARVLVMYASGNAQIKELVDSTLAALDAPIEAVFSTLGRTAARAIETKAIADQMAVWNDELAANIAAGDLQNWNGVRWEPRTWPAHAEGFGWHEAPRGALGHWVVIDGGRISNYQLVVPTTWNGSPRDHLGQPSPYESSLVGTPMADPEQPLEILRTIHSFDPCMSCAIHLIDVNGQDLGEVDATPGLSCRVL